MAIFGVYSRPLEQTEYFSIVEPCHKDDLVLINSDQGLMIGTIVSGPLEVLPGSNESDLPSIIRVANSEDLEIYHKNKELSREAFKFCQECVKNRKLDMKLVNVEVFFDRSKLIFYFTAPNRIDFRELVKDLVREYRARIELRQIGVRHETKMLGAIGNCGMVCCCRGYLRKFAPVTIKMAKEQNLFLNPAKISGICGRLLCCLSYEQDNYEAFHRESPKPCKKYQTSKGTYKIIRVNMFSNTITAIGPDNAEIEMSLEDWRALKPGKGVYDKDAKIEDMSPVSDFDLKKLEDSD